MVFSSQIFLFIFLPVVLALYIVIPKRFRNISLLVFSFIFYAWSDWAFIIVLLFYIGFDFLFGLLIQKSQTYNEIIQKIIFVFAIIINLGILVFFKYTNFLVENINQAFSVNIPIKELIVPLGISFFAFSGISYLLDVRSGKISASKNPIEFSLYISFFPKLLQGPIVRFDTFISQISNREIVPSQVESGLSRITIGLAKKVLLADQLGITVDQIFNKPAMSNLPSVAWLGAIGYALQIYFDFSGYSDIAIGLGKIFGFTFLENFNNPYHSLSITEFWRRWHISLSSWFRDYLFFPLEIKRKKVKRFRQETNTIIVFFLTGLWHGASWNFIVWGLLNGIEMALEKIGINKLKLKVPNVIKWIFTSVLLIIGWVIFRSSTLGYAFSYLSIMFGVRLPLAENLPLSWYINNKTIFIYLAGILACLPWKVIFEKVKIENFTAKGSKYLSTVLLILLFLLSSIYILSSSTNSFIYFKF